MDLIYQKFDWLVWATLGLIVIGFAQTYFLLVPHFSGVSTAEHYHLVVMTIWCVLLVSQPILIRSKKLELHRQLGKLSYLLVPILLHSIFVVVKTTYVARLAEGMPIQSYARLAIQLPDIAAFALFYGLAIFYRKKTKFHVRFMVGTMLLMIGPAIFRIFRDVVGIAPATASGSTFIISDIICAVLLLVDIRRKQPWQPFAVILVVLLIEHSLFLARFSSIWQDFASRFVAVFF